MKLHKTQITKLCNRHGVSKFQVEKFFVNLSGNKETDLAAIDGLTLRLSTKRAIKDGLDIVYNN